MSETLLVELLTEELPPKSLARLGEVFRDEVCNGLLRHRLCERNPANADWFATPRRLAVLVRDVAAAAADRTVDEKIMPVAVALDASGKPTPALLKKLEAKGIAASELPSFERRMDGKSETFFCQLTVAGAQLDRVLAGVVADALKKLPIPKVMRWGDGEAQFVRPVHGLIMLHGARVVPGQVLGLESGDATRGHRFLSGGALRIPHAAEYEGLLESKGRVIASFARRREAVERQLADYARQHGVRLNEGYRELIDEVTALVEWPAVYAGQFEEKYLQVPQECLILTMQRNQKYFPLLDAQGRLLPRFLIVSNMLVQDPRHIVGGNQRVIRPRLADARFFYEQDRKQPLASRVARLAQVVYHNKLGSQLARVERLQRLAGHVAGHLQADAQLARRAAYLAKADLLTDMVGEFPELQGTMGRYYALHDGEAQAVADAIEEHYRPRMAGDALPRGNVALSVALADRLDALVGFFGIGQVPTGDKDPFGLRRAALGVLRMLAETPLPLDLADLIAEAGSGFPAGTLQPGHAEALHEFMLERLRHHLRESGQPHEAVEAVLAGKPRRIDRVGPRLSAVQAFVALPEAQALAAANKRIVNILRKADTASVPAEPDVLLLQDEAERELFRRMTELAPVVDSLVAGEDYAAALCALAGLRAPVDRYFDEVMVMADEPLTRQNRLAMLGRLARLMNQVADISRLAI